MCARSIVFVFLTHIKNGKKDTHTHTHREEVSQYFRENRESSGSMDFIWCNKMMDCSLLFSIVFWNWFCTHTNICLSSICVSIFTGYKNWGTHTFRFTSSSLIIGIFHRFELPHAEWIQANHKPIRRRPRRLTQKVIKLTVYNNHNNLISSLLTEIYREHR